MAVIELVGGRARSRGSRRRRDLPRPELRQRPWRAVSSSACSAVGCLVQPLGLTGARGQAARRLGDRGGQRAHARPQVFGPGRAAVGLEAGGARMTLRLGERAARIERRRHRRLGRGRRLARLAGVGRRQPVGLGQAGGGLRGRLVGLGSEPLGVGLEPVGERRPAHVAAAERAGRLLERGGAPAVSRSRAVSKS